MRSVLLNQFNSTLESDYAVFMFSLDGYFIDANEGGEALLGISSAQIIGSEMGKYVAEPEHAD